MHKYNNIDANIHKYTCMRLNRNTYIIHVYIYTYIHINIIDAYMCTCIHVYMTTCIHTKVY